MFRQFIVVAVAMAVSSLDSMAQDPRQKETRTLEALPWVKCAKEAQGNVCRPTRGHFVWCANESDLVLLEGGVVNDMPRQERVIQEAVASSTCRTAPAVVVNASGEAASVVEAVGDGRPLVSKTVFASTPSYPACVSDAYCAVKPRTTVWACPAAADLAKPDNEKLAAKCVRFNGGDTLLAGFKPSNSTAISFSTGDGANSSFYADAGDFLGIRIQPLPRNRYRRWCKTGEWCEVATPTLFCGERAALDRVLATPAGEGRRNAITAEESCRIMARGNPLKPAGMGSEKDRVVYVEHPVFKSGVTTVDVFKAVHDGVPMTVSPRVTDLKLAFHKSPEMRAIAVQGQGSAKAAVAFRRLDQSVAAFCKDFSEEFGDLNTCMKNLRSDPRSPPAVFRANCLNKVLYLDGRTLKLFPRPAKMPDDAYYRDDKKFIWKDLEKDEWINSTTADGELTLDTAFDALCPAVNEDALGAVVIRDPKAVFPRDIRGVWIMNREVCEVYRKNPADTDGQGVMMIQERELSGYELTERVNQVRQVATNAWEIDVTWEGEGMTGTYGTRYQIGRDGLIVSHGDQANRWIRCPR